MQSILARLRERAGQSPPPQEGSLSTRSSVSDARQTVSTQQSPVDRPIIQDIASLLEAVSHAEEVQTPMSPQPGLRPPRRPRQAVIRRSQSVGGQRGIRTYSSHDAFKQQKENLPPASALETPHADSWSISSSKRRYSPLSDRLASASPWPTFGRSNERLEAIQGQSAPPSAWDPHLSSVVSLIPRRSSGSSGKGRKSSHSKHGSYSSLHRHTLTSRASSDVLPSHSAASTPEGSSCSQLDEFDDDYDISASPMIMVPSLTRKESTNSRYMHSRSSRSRSIQSHSMLFNSSMTSQQSRVSVGSPHTFGNPSPPSSRPLSSARASQAVSLMQPLPPPSHPGLSLGISMDSQMSHEDSHNMHIRDTQEYPEWSLPLDLPSTYPPHRRSKTTEEARVMLETDSAISIALGPGLRRVSSTPVVYHIPRRPTSTYLNVPSQSGQLPSDRRASAKWNAQQALAGVTSARPSMFGWPAEVAQHLLRLAIGEEPVQAEEFGQAQTIQRPVDAEPRASQVVAQTSSCYPSSRPIPARFDSASLQSAPVFAATVSGGSRDLVQAMDTLGAIKLQNVVKANGGVSKPNGASDMLQTRPAHASTHNPITPKACNRRAFHVSTPSPVAESFKGSGAGPSSSPNSSAFTTPPSRTRSTHRPSRSASEPGLKPVPETPTNPKGKRKADELEVTPPDQKNGHHATFLIPPESRRSTRISETSNVPSSYHRKRARLSTSSPNASPSQTPRSRPVSAAKSLSTSDAASWPSRSAGPPHGLFRATSRATTAGSTHHADSVADRRSRRRSVSEVSIPISALIFPHAPSITRSSQYHMRDPHKLPKVTPTKWVPHLRSQDEDTSPWQAWCFFVGFILFPLWWLVSFAPVPQTRRVGGTDMEKAVTLDDPQIEHDARTWRNRCRIMAVVSFLTYIPFIILVAIFVPRHT